MRIRGEVIGDAEQFEDDMQKQVTKSNQLPSAMDEGARILQEAGKQIAVSKGLIRTGAGIAGIVVERDGDDRLIGWSGRPNFHLYFHEIGTYKDYPRPHLRPAADQKGNEAMQIVEDRTIN